MKNALAEDNELFSLEAEWMDKISPLEFKAAEAALAQGNNVDFVKDSLEGIARLYSDQAIRFHLEQLNPYYSKAENLLKDYERLVELRENSGADDKSLESLRKTKDAWENDLLNIEMNSQE